mmetsp:Transcript_35718/g.83625  ORF Transcript_35718/g.83625 Transcript_35718/m.83625 type:complete len:814 (+) Transcript_35718:147-2588(+)|eukprot:CAMPEP_0178393244 /NCGR_PEP_ID=MMETSP0689_2-20121128/12087_1 /TAXON_ID=160604 /ORGANISM="Amphidinium massartii, Strain CS-259" /LENGTH=813 /DNA_ID=CAMNT_0020013829 /DNA_START=54 /DNA_END=2495 /DNA_ORIENTATION=+
MPSESSTTVSPAAALVLREGERVDYWSCSLEAWVTAVVVRIDRESGAVELDVKPNYMMDLEEQKDRLRPQSKPSTAQLLKLQQLLSDDTPGLTLNHRISEWFSAYATPSGAGDGSGNSMQKTLQLEECKKLAREIDAEFGIAGTLNHLKRLLSKEQSGLGFSESKLHRILWDYFWRLNSEYAIALSVDHTAPSAQQQGRQPRDFYRFGRELGRGTYGFVQEATCQKTGLQRAIKTIEKANNNFELTREELECEITYLRQLDHPHVVRLYEYFEDETSVYLVMDLCTGGDLAKRVFDAKRSKQPLQEAWLAPVMEQILQAIAHVHSRGVIHLDLKAANIMLSKSQGTLAPGAFAQQQLKSTLGQAPAREPIPHVMVIDLGVAQLFQPGNFKNGMPSGTPATMAPEVWNGDITPEADVFSMGCMLFEMLTFNYPFNCPSDWGYALGYWSEKPKPDWSGFQPLVGSNRSRESQELCRRMLALDRKHRPSAADCLQSPFFQGGKGDVRATLPADSGKKDDLLRRLAKAAERSVLHRSVAWRIAEKWPANCNPTVRKLFKEVDMNGTGRVQKARIVKLLQQSGCSPAEAKEAAEAMDLTREGTITWSQFVAASIDLSDASFHACLRSLFDEADEDKDGLLGQSDLSTMLVGAQVAAASMSGLMLEICGRNEEGSKVDWHDFHTYMAGKATAASFSRANSKQESLDLAAKVQNALSDEVLVASPTDLDKVVDNKEEGSGSCGKRWSVTALLKSHIAEVICDAAERVHDKFMVDEGGVEERLAQLEAMGYTDRERNLEMLRVHGNNVRSVVTALCEAPST